MTSSTRRLSTRPTLAMAYASHSLTMLPPVALVVATPGVVPMICGPSNISAGTDRRGAQTGFASKRVWGIGRRLMGLLATGMVSNLLKRMNGRVDIRYMYSKVSFMGAIFWVQGFAARSKCIAVVMSLSKIHPIRNRSRQRGLHGPGTRTAIHLPIGPCFGHGDSLAKVLAHLYLVRPSLGLSLIHI